MSLFSFALSLVLQLFSCNNLQAGRFSKDTRGKREKNYLEMRSRIKHLTFYNNALPTELLHAKLSFFTQFCTTIDFSILYNYLFSAKARRIENNIIWRFPSKKYLEMQCKEYNHACMCLYFYLYKSLLGDSRNSKPYDLSLYNSTTR